MNSKMTATSVRSIRLSHRHFRFFSMLWSMHKINNESFCELSLVMRNREGYDEWSSTYDSVENKTRDLEAKALRALLEPLPFTSVLELGAGTGKNTEWLAGRTTQLTAVDFSAQMLQAAREKIGAAHVRFAVADITKTWDFFEGQADLVSCSLVLEHIDDIDFIFHQATGHLRPGGFFYIGELHPFRQYGGSKARFETSSGVFTLDCFTHHISDYMRAASENGLHCVRLSEWFDEEATGSAPRIIALLFQKLQFEPGGPDQ